MKHDIFKITYTDKELIEKRKLWGNWIGVNLDKSYDENLKTIIDGCSLLLKSNQPPLDEITIVIKNEHKRLGETPTATIGMKWVVGEIVEASEVIV